MKSRFRLFQKVRKRWKVGCGSEPINKVGNCPTSPSKKNTETLTVGSYVCSFVIDFAPKVARLNQSIKAE